MLCAIQIPAATIPLVYIKYEFKQVSIVQGERQSKVTRAGHKLFIFYSLIFSLKNVKKNLCMTFVCIRRIKLSGDGLLVEEGRGYFSNILERFWI